MRMAFSGSTDFPHWGSIARISILLVFVDMEPPEGRVERSEGAYSTQPLFFGALNRDGGRPIPDELRLKAKCCALAGARRFAADYSTLRGSRWPDSGMSRRWFLMHIVRMGTRALCRSSFAKLPKKTCASPDRAYVARATASIVPSFRSSATASRVGPVRTWTLHTIPRDPRWRATVERYRSASLPSAAWPFPDLTAWKRCRSDPSVLAIRSAQ